MADLVEYTTCPPLLCASDRSGSHNTAASTLPDSYAARTPAVPSSALMNTNLIDCFFFADSEEFSIASISIPCDGVYCRSATDLPARSSTDRIAVSFAIIASPPWVFASSITTLPS